MIFFCVFMLHPQEMTFNSVCKGIYLKRGGDSIAQAVMSDPAVNDGFLISIWEKDCDKENNPRFQNACLSPVFFFIFPFIPSLLT